MRTTQRGAALLAALCLPLVAGCSGEPEGGSSPTATSPQDAPVLQPGRPGESNTSLTGTDAVATSSDSHNAADVTFLTDMIVHHAQAVVMGDLVEGRLTDDSVEDIASRITDEQRPEMDGMASSLKAWGEEPPPQASNPTFGMRDHHASGHADMPGMATEEELTELAEADGAEVDRLYLELMIAHHEGAVEMCDDVREQGRDERTSELADDITVTQQKQVDQMRGMLAAL